MKKKYFEEIDGLRFYVFLLILTNHSGIWLKSQGHTFFFMLSGFLIGYSSFNDILKHKKFSLSRYFLRRVLRTFPLYFLIILLCGLSYLVLKRFAILITLDNYWSYFFFLQNYYVGDSLFILKNLWAMAVTEQLYFVWGILIFLLQRSILKVVIPLAFFLIFVAYFTEFCDWYIYESALTYAGIYLLGAYSGLLLHKKDNLYQFIISLKIWQSWLLFLLSILVCLFGFLMSSDLFVIREYVLGFGFCSILILLCYSKLDLGFVLKNTVIKYLGRISYGLYCYHAIVITLVTKYFAYKGMSYSSTVLFLICLVLTIVIAIISYEFYERKFLQMKRSLR